MIDDTSHTIQITSSTANSTFAIQQLQMTSLFKYLGVNKTSSGNQPKKIKTLTTHEQGGARILQNGNLNHFQIGI